MRYQAIEHGPFFERTSNKMFLNQRNLNCLKLQRHDAGRYGFSAIRLKHLETTKATLVNLAIDVSASACEYKSQLEAISSRIVGAITNLDQRNQILLRLIGFHRFPEEVHGFKPLSECESDDYRDALYCGGTTALTDAALNGFEAISEFSHYLKLNGLLANGLSVVVTDGMDLASCAFPDELGYAQVEAMRQGKVESLTSVLAGIPANAPQDMHRILMEFRCAAGFTKYIAVNEMTALAAMQLADYIVAAVISVNAALGSRESSPQLPNAGSLETCEDLIQTTKKPRRRNIFPLLYCATFEPPPNALAKANDPTAVSSDIATNQPPTRPSRRRGRPRK